MQRRCTATSQRRPPHDITTICNNIAQVLAEINYDPIVRIELVGGLAVSPHGIFTAAGFMAGAWFFLRHTRRLGVRDATIISVLTRAAVGAIVGARLAFIANNLGSFASPIEWFKIWEGGISLLGGLFGAMLVAWWCARRARLDFLGLLDIAVPWLPLGIAIGRIGDIVIADHLGRSTTMPWGFRCPAEPDVGQNVGSPCAPDRLVHLTAAYDLLAALGIFGLMMALRGRVGVRKGQPALLLVVLYGANRFLLDFLRDDLRRWGLTGSQWAAGVAVLAGVILLWHRRDRPNGRSPDDSSTEPVVRSTRPGPGRTPD